MSRGSGRAKAVPAPRPVKSIHDDTPGTDGSALMSTAWEKSIDRQEIIGKFEFVRGKKD